MRIKEENNMLLFTRQNVSVFVNDNKANDMEYPGRFIDVSIDEMNEEMRKKGLFVLISIQMIEKEDILPLHCKRKTIEQGFDTGMNNAELIPIRVHNVEGFMGRFLISFIASAIYITANQMLKGSAVCANGVFYVLQNLKCKVFDKNIIVRELNMKMNDIAKYLMITHPSQLDLWREKLSGITDKSKKQEEVHVGKENIDWVFI